MSILPTSLYTHVDILYEINLIQDMLRLDETTWTPELRDTYEEQKFKGLFWVRDMCLLDKMADQSHALPMYA